MTFRRGGAGKRRDANEPGIRQALTACGRRSWQIGGLGLPDLLIWSPTPVVWQGRGFWLPVEVKTADGSFTEAQADIVWPTIRSINEALHAVGVTG